MSFVNEFVESKACVCCRLEDSSYPWMFRRWYLIYYLIMTCPKFPFFYGHCILKIICIDQHWNECVKPKACICLLDTVDVEHFHKFWNKANDQTKTNQKQFPAKNTQQQESKQTTSPKFKKKPQPHRSITTYKIDSILSKLECFKFFIICNI